MRGFHYPALLNEIQPEVMMEKGIIVIDEIPQNCTMCRMRKTDGYCTVVSKDVFYFGLNYDKPEWCPIKTVSRYKEDSVSTDSTNEKAHVSKNTNSSEKTVKCDACNKRSVLADTFIFKGKAYCMDCLYSLLMEMANDGHVTINFDNCEQNGILVEF